MIRSLALKFGRAPNRTAENIPTTPVTVFVGPNNSGKSKVLTELHRYCTNGQRNLADVILDHIEFEGISEQDAEERITNITLSPRHNETVQSGNIIVGKRGNRINVSKQRLVQSFTDPNGYSAIFCQHFLSYNTLMLDGKSRINLISDQKAGDLLQPAQTSFQLLFRDDPKRAEVRRIVRDAFGAYFVIDPTHLGTLRLRLSPEEPVSSVVERGIHDEAVKFHSAAQSIAEASDGVKAFTGIITEIVAGDPAILLIDEPEAFLHPALSFSLGKEIALASSGSEKRLFVSTHSPNFVMGCIQSGAPVNIIRLTYRSGVATARLLASEDLLSFMRNPLLRSTNVLSGLFYEFVVVTESDADRAFYQEINERLVRGKAEWGIPNCLFLNAQNKQTVPTILKPLRNLGIPAAGIVDVDVLKEGGAVWGRFLDGGFVPELERNSLASLRSAIKSKIDATEADMNRQGGLNVLNGNDREAANNLCARLQEYGLFVVRRGELESWLPSLGAAGHGPAWLVSIFEKMGEDPSAVDYVRPGTDDVWSFMAEVRYWLSDPARKGIPS